MMRSATERAVFGLCILVIGCSSPDTEPDGQGGAGASSGGAQTSGGSSAATGGSQSSGGAQSAGGATTSGGMQSSGGASAGSTASGSGLPGATRLRALDSAQKGTLCDWYAEKMGGYGATHVCADMSSVEVVKDQSTCVAAALDFPCPTITVANFEECTLAQVPSGGCMLPDEQCHWLSCR